MLSLMPEHKSYFILELFSMFWVHKNQPPAPSPIAQLWTDFWWFMSQTANAMIVKIWDRSWLSYTNFDESWFQTMVKNAQPRGFAAHDFQPEFDARVVLPHPPIASMLTWLWGNPNLPYYYFPAEWEPTYLPFTLTVPEDFRSWNQDDWYGKLYWYINFTINDNREVVGRNATFRINFNYANQQIECPVAWSNWTNQGNETLDTCILVNEMIWTPVYQPRDDLTTPETWWRFPEIWNWFKIEPYMKIQWVIRRDNRDEYTGDIIPLQVWFHYIKDRIGTRAARYNP